MRTCFIYNANWTPGLHLGAARIAVLNWAYAEKHKGKLVICCDDLAPRLTVKNVKHFSTLLSWLGMGYHEGLYHYTDAKVDFEKAVKYLLRTGAAYLDYASTEDMRLERNDTPIDHPFLYSRKWRVTKGSQVTKYQKSGRKPVIRLRMPRVLPDEYYTHSVMHHDAVGGDKMINLHHEHDYIIKTFDGGYTPYLTTALTYRKYNIDLAFVDARQMPSLPAQIFLSKHLNFKLPKFAHIPFLLGPNGPSRFTHRRERHYEQNKSLTDLANRGRAISGDSTLGPMYPSQLEFYKKVGFTPEALKQYLLASSTVNSSIYNQDRALSLEEMVSGLNLCEVSPSKDMRFNADHLLHIQKMHFESLSINRKCWLVNDYLINAKISDYWPHGDYEKSPPKKLVELVEGLSDKMSIAGDILRLTDFFDSETLELT